MTKYSLVVGPGADPDIRTAFDWYENEQRGLGRQFLDEVRASYHRIAGSPFAYRDIRGGIRRAFVRRFPYAVYFAVEGEVVTVLAVLHLKRDPAEWQRRRG
jgi:toxin ParE1/3/4